MSFYFFPTGRRTSETSDRNQLLNNSQAVGGNTETESSEQRRTNLANSRQTNRTQESTRSRPVQRSASLNQANSTTTPRQVSRHHSVTTADVQQQSSGSRSGHGRRPPPLIRGGFLQSHVNGPSIPVYTIPGSNEAYIALTDLPSLQMPTMDDVPAYVSDVHDSQFPVDEPPPYTPSADMPPPPMFTPSHEMPDIPERPSPQPDIVNSTITSQPSPQSDVTIETVRQVLGSSRSPHTPDMDNTNNLNEGAGSVQTSPQHHVIVTISGNNLMGHSAQDSPQHPTSSHDSGNQVGNYSSNDPRLESGARSRSVSRSRENSPTRLVGIRQEPTIHLPHNVQVPQNTQTRVDPLVSGARPKNSHYHNQGSGSHGNRNQSRGSPQHRGDGKKKKRAKSPSKTSKEKSKHKSQAAKKLPNVHTDKILVPETEIRSPKKSPKKKTEHRSRSENRNNDSKQHGDNKKKRKSKSPEKKWSDSKSKSPSKMDQSKSRKRTGSPSKGMRHLKLNIPTDDSSGTDSMEGILDLVESVHTTQKHRSKDQKDQVKSKERNKNLSDSRV